MSNEQQSFLSRAWHVWKSLTGCFVNDIGIDLGTMNTLLWTSSAGRVVLDEPSYVAQNADTGKVRAVGLDAKKMLGATPERINVIRPMREGVIANASVTDEMLRIFMAKATGHGKIMQPRVLIAVPSGITEVGVRAVQESAIRAGARSVRLVEEPYASAIGVGLPVNEPEANMIVDIGGGTTEVAIISLGYIVSCNSVKCGGDAMDAAIINHMLREHKLQIGAPTAEQIKINIGSAYDLPEKLTMEVRGLDVTGQSDRLPRAVMVNSDEIRECLRLPVTNIMRAVRKTINDCSSELAARLLNTGITLAGGGSQLRGMDQLLSADTGLRVTIGKDPMRAVVNGTGKLLENANELFSQPQNTLVGRGTIADHSDE